MQMENPTALTQDELRKRFSDLLAEIGTLESAIGSTYKVAGGWLNSQDFSEVDATGSDIHGFLESTANFANAVQRDAADLRNLLVRPSDHQAIIHSLSQEQESLAQGADTTVKALNELASAESRREHIFRQDLADATVKFLDALHGYVDRAAKKAVELLEGWDRVKHQADSRDFYNALKVTFDTIAEVVTRDSTACNVVSTDAGLTMGATKELLQTHGWRQGQSNDLLMAAMRQERLLRHFPDEARVGLTFDAGLQLIIKKVLETFGTGGPLQKLTQAILDHMDKLDDQGFEFPVRIGELASASDERY